MRRIILIGALSVIFSFSVFSQKEKLGSEKSIFPEQIFPDQYSTNNNTELLEHLINTQLSESGITLTDEYISPADIPESYNFDWHYDIKIASKTGEVIKQYLLNPNNKYFGIKMQLQEEIYLVIDPERLITVLFRGDEQQEMLTASRISRNSKIFSNRISSISPDKNLQIRKIGDKAISNIASNGWQTENQQHVLSYYYTTSPSIKSFGLYKIELPIAFSENLLIKQEGLLMQLNLEGIKNAKNNITITCIGLEQRNFNLSKRDYNRIAGN
jgi:hypothetical protein